MEGGVLGVAAFVDEFFAGGFGGADLDELLAMLVVVFAEVGAEAALTVVNNLHDTPFDSRARSAALDMPLTYRCGEFVDC